MPAKNILKQYVPNSYYHIYNRGVEKRTIFQDPQDYKVFLSYLKQYLSPNPPNISIRKSRKSNNLHQEITLLAYCLMPNHFHFFVKQKNEKSIEKFMRSLTTKYVMYFNKRHNRVGGLFQSRYKAVKINSEKQFTYITKYIHRNPTGLAGMIPARHQKLSEYPYSSYSNYLGKINQSWVQPQEVLSLFSQSNPSLTYQFFVEEKPSDQEKLAIKHLVIDD